LRRGCFHRTVLLRGVREASLTGFPFFRLRCCRQLDYLLEVCQFPPSHRPGNGPSPRCPRDVQAFAPFPAPHHAGKALPPTLFSSLSFPMQPLFPFLLGRLPPEARPPGSAIDPFYERLPFSPFLSAISLAAPLARLSEDPCIRRRFKPNTRSQTAGPQKASPHFVPRLPTPPLFQNGLSPLPPFLHPAAISNPITP